MENLKVFDRNNNPTDELSSTVEKVYNGIKLKYKEVYYLDFDVDENTGLINKNKVKHYTKNQISRNLRALKNAYLIAKGAADPNEIISFRTKYQIPASTLSIILGFSKNTISNIENDGISSLSSGRFIKIFLHNKDIIYQYIQLCDSIDEEKKNELSKRIMEESF